MWQKLMTRTWQMLNKSKAVFLTGFQPSVLAVQSSTITLEQRSAESWFDVRGVALIQIATHSGHRPVRILTHPPPPYLPALALFKILNKLFLFYLINICLSVLRYEMKNEKNNSSYKYLFLYSFNENFTRMLK